jgi:SAM-dependent methyltransferase
MSFPGTEGYAAQADALAAQYETARSLVTHPHLLALWPAPPAAVCDIGAGTGRDAAAFAARGHPVLAVEPTAEMRAHGRRLHADPAIVWLDDGLPDLAAVHKRGQRFGLLYLNAVLMHLDPAERARGLARLAPLLDDGGVLFLTLRHGPVPPGRRMFEVAAEEIVALAAAQGLASAHRSARRDGFGRDQVTWTYLAFRNGRCGPEAPR